MENTNHSAEAVLAQICAIALADVTQVVRVEDGQPVLRPVQELTSDQRASIASIEKGTGGIKIKFYDKLKALELLCKCFGLFDGASRPQEADSPLLQAIVESTKEVIATNDLPEIQQAATAGDDLVEQTRS